MLAASILAIPLNEPERLFKRKNDLRQDYLYLIKTWHPDINKDPLADKVLAHVNMLYKQAQDKVHNSVWNPVGVLELTGKDGKIRQIKYRAKRSFELGEVYISDKLVTFVVAKCHEKLVLSGLRAIGTIRYPNEDFKKSLEQYFPKVEHYFDTDGVAVICMRKDRREVLLADLIHHLGGKIDVKHVAWIMSSLFNLASFMKLSYMTHNAISANTVYVNPEMHSVALYGGWFYAVELGQHVVALPPDTYKLASRKLLTNKVADYAFDIECIKAVGRACSGDISGTTLRTRSDIPAPFTNFLLAPAKNDAIKAYEAWIKVLEESFGPRKFVKLDATIDQIYPKEN